MKIQLKKFVFYKKDKNGKGIIFSMDNDSNKILVVSDIVNLVAERLTKGETLGNIRVDILNEYDVTPEKLDEDLNQFAEKLDKLGFLEA